MGDRFLVGYPWEGKWHQPPVKVVACYVDQRGADDQSVTRGEEFGFKVYPTVAETLRVGTGRLAVDGVLLIGEHGSYPRNAKGQILYPRAELFRQISDVFEADSRSVPVFNDKHLSWSFEKAKAMVDASRRLRFPFLAGSSLPVTWRLPAVDVPYGADIAEALMVGVGSSDPMDFHALEALQCMIERRRGGETGVRAVQLLDGEAVWKAGDEGRWSWRLLSAALSRSDSRVGLGLTDGRPQELVESREVTRLARNPAAYLIEYRDGFRATLLMLNGATQDYTFACRLRGKTRPLSTQFLLPPTPNVTYSYCLMRAVEQMLVTGKAPYPVERTLLTSGILEACLTSRLEGNVHLETPHLSVAYQPPRESLFAQT